MRCRATYRGFESHLFRHLVINPNSYLLGMGSDLSILYGGNVPSFGEVNQSKIGLIANGPKFGLAGDWLEVEPISAYVIK